MINYNKIKTLMKKAIYWSDECSSNISGNIIHSYRKATGIFIDGDMLNLTPYFFMNVKRLSYSFAN